MTTLEVHVSPKSLRETLCIAQTRILASSIDADRAGRDVAHLQVLIDECDRHRPLGPDGKHGDRHTPTCGCEDAATEPERVSVKMMTGRGFGVYVHRDPITPLQIGGCPWPDGPCAGHRTGLGGMPLLTVPASQAMHVPHWHASAPDRLCSEIMCHATHGRPCRYCGGAPCRITPVERGA